MNRNGINGTCELFNKKTRKKCVDVNIFNSIFFFGQIFKLNFDTIKETRRRHYKMEIISILFKFDGKTKRIFRLCINSYSISFIETSFDTKINDIN